MEEKVCLEENFERVRENIRRACERSGRSQDSVTLIAVSKFKPVSMIREAMACGQKVFGENRVQELCDKIEEIGPGVSWHMIGHLQQNKVKYIVGKVKRIHSVDSVSLAKQISKEAQKKGVTVRILLEVNVAEEESKFGFRLEDTEAAVREIALLPGIHICGLMTIAPFVENPEENRIYFKKLYQLSVDIKEKNIDNVDMSELSMGMTGDYEVAIEEGATMVRVGTGLFGSR
ncbi:MAG: YggS family pyridoxal phosphate-dependent enzyme [Lachnospiraceae bacterium]|nr:YggS family pyridoxal phosphate-dependent enzyme [Candidatus Fimimorpha excrementavium]